MPPILTGAVTNPAGTLQIDTTAPTVVRRLARASPASGDLNAGKTVTLTLNLSEAVTVAGGTPTLTLNDGGTATYTRRLRHQCASTFSYTVGAGQNTSDLRPPPSISTRRPSPTAPAMPPTCRSPVLNPERHLQIDTTTPTSHR